MTPRHEHSGRSFAMTHWSMVTQAANADANDVHRALVELCQRYWYPVYAYIRRCGHTPAIAQDITRTFLQYLFERSRDENAAGSPQFRRYLLAHMHAFLAGDWRSAVSGDVTVEFPSPPCDLEIRNLHDNADAESPEQAYQQSFALEVVARSLARLHEEAHETDRLDMYEALEPFIASDPALGEYEELARRLHTRPLALVIALKRLRQRFRELADAELADVVASPEELLAEQQALHAALRRSQ